MTGGRGIPRRNLPDFDEALRLAWVDAHTPSPGEKPAPKPLCDGRWSEFVDYDAHNPPSPERAEALCGPCELLDLCRANARHVRPSVGIWGGEVWVDRKRLPIAPAKFISTEAQDLVDKRVA